jgi:hypothetical protein
MFKAAAVSVYLEERFGACRRSEGYAVLLVAELH